MPPRTLVIVIAVLCLLAVAVGVFLTQPPAEHGIQKAWSITELLGELDPEFPPVPDRWNFRFPADHASHSEYRTERWAVTGLSRDARGRPFAIQLEILRLGLVAQAPERDSRWATSNIYAAGLSVSDAASGRLRHELVVARAAVGLSGTAEDPLRVWVGDWIVEADSPFDDGSVGLNLQATGEAVELQLGLTPTKGLLDSHQLGAQTGTPFVFYLQPAMQGTGRIRAGDSQANVGGRFVFEHSWGELPLPGSPVATDTFTLFLDDERDLLLVRTHPVAGPGRARAAGLLIRQDGTPVMLPETAISLEPKDTWKSERTGSRFPISWHLRIPDHRVDVELLPAWEDQEAVSWDPFWLGPVGIRGDDNLSGNGIMRLDGYFQPED